jgi:hypothetical protein
LAFGGVVGGVMSQTETMLLFVLGFCVALFVVLLFARGVWAMMGTWSGWRDHRRQPAAMLELQAERDSLKAEKAMMAQKLEASLNDMKMRMAEQMAEVSRSRNRILDLGQTIKDRDASIARLQAQVDEKISQSQSLQAQIDENGKTLGKAYASVAQREDELSKLQTAHHDLQTALSYREGQIRSLTDESFAMRQLVNLGPAINAIVNPAHGQQASEAERAQVATASFGKQSVVNSFETRFKNGHSDPSPGPDPTKSAALPDGDELDREVSNVLSLADRVRSLQSGMKK